MFTLVEPLLITDLQDRPDLGCAVLTAACRDHGIGTRVVSAQVTYMQYLVDNIGEAFDTHLFLKARSIESATIDEMLQEYGERALPTIVRELHQLAKSKDLRFYVTPSYVGFLATSFREIMKETAVAYEQGRKACWFEAFIDSIGSYGNGIVGLSVYQFDRLSMELMRGLKNRGNHVIIGGSGTVRLEESEIERLLLDGYCDVIVVGRAEHILPEILNRIESSSSLRGIANTFYLSNGRVQGYLDSVPHDFITPDFSNHSLDEYLFPERLLPVQSSHGCS